MQDRDWQAEIRLLQERQRKAREALGVSESAGKEEIQAAWRRESLKHHPDRNNNSPESNRRFILITCAYKCLTEGVDCELLDSEAPPGEAPAHDKFRLENPSGYFAWWREKYFE